MKPIKLTFSIFGLTLLGMSIGLTLSYLATFRAKNMVNNSTILPLVVDHYSGPSAPVLNMSYVYISFEDMIKYSDVILVGQITNIGETKSNQDSGEYWEETIKDEIGETTISAFPYYEVTLSPTQTIVDSLGVQDQVVVTVLGNSPLGYGGDLSLKNGDEIIVFLTQGEIAWYYGEVTYDKRTNSFESGRKPVLGFMAAPDQSYLRKGPDGLYQFVVNDEQVGPFSLDELIRLIQEKRGTP